MTTLAQAAEEYARRGWHVFPCAPRRKRPIVDNGFHRATTDLAQVREWWARWPEANIALAPGRSGLLVLDWDSPAGQQEAQRIGLYAEPTLVVETARGEHIYFHHPGGHIGNRKLNEVLDVRADGGYVLLPPSVHPTGATYRALGKMDLIRHLPSGVVELLRKAERPDVGQMPNVAPEPPVDAGTPRRRRYVAAAIESEVLALAAAPEGNRNNRLNEAAFSLARFAATGEAHPGKLADALRMAARRAGLEETEIEKTIDSAFRAREVEAWPA